MASPGRPRVRMPKKAVLFARVDEETAAAFRRMARRYGVQGAVLMRWLIDDALEGRWKPKGFALPPTAPPVAPSK